jgi:deazaflavin-dependent oxidoreductase (nitroreductase family)
LRETTGSDSLSVKGLPCGKTASPGERTEQQKGRPTAEHETPPTQREQAQAALARRPLLLLHHTGARSGTQRVSPVADLRDGDHYGIFGSQAGTPTHPAWCHNLIAHPRAQIQVSSDTLEVKATEARGEERNRLYAAMAQRGPVFGDDAAKTDRSARCSCWRRPAETCTAGQSRRSTLGSMCVRRPTGTVGA